MNKLFVKCSLLAVLALGIAASPIASHAQNAATNAAPKKKLPLTARTLPFHGKLKAVDASAKTITVGNETLQITSETKITKAGKPAMLSDGTVGDDVAGSYKKTADGKSDVVSLRFGPKPPADSGSKTNKPNVS